MRPVIRSRRVAVPLAVLALAGTGVAAYGAAFDDGVRYRTVAATRGDVVEELTVAGTISPSGTSELAFGTDGTVARVRVQQGDEVREGQVIAVLDRSSLRAAVDRAKSDLADARAQLAADRDAQATAVDTASGSTAKGSGSTSTPASTPTSAGADQDSGSAGSNTELLAQLRTEQDAVTTAQSAATAALATAADRLADQQQACSDPVASEPEPSGDPTETPASAVLSEACTTTLAAVQSAQATASEAQTTLQTALQALGSTLTGALGSLSAPAPAKAADSPQTPSSANLPSSEPSSPTTATRTVTAATLAQDQAAIDQAVAALASARADLRGAVVRASADSTVAALDVGAGDEVATGDTVVTLVAPGLTTVAVEVGATQAAELETGTAATVTPAGATEALAGTVGRIEHTATSDSATSSDPTYAVQVVLADRDLALAEGMPATVAMVVGAAEGVVVVPASALTDGTVTVVDDTGQARRTRVSTGLVGATEVEITDGLDAGDEVVLADLDAALPSGDSDQQGRGGLGSGFGGDGAMVPMGPPPGVTLRQ